MNRTHNILRLMVNRVVRFVVLLVCLVANNMVHSMEFPITGILPIAEKDGKKHVLLMRTRTDGRDRVFSGLVLPSESRVEGVRYFAEQMNDTWTQDELNDAIQKALSDKRGVSYPDQVRRYTEGSLKSGTVLGIHLPYRELTENLREIEQGTTKPYFPHGFLWISLYDFETLFTKDDTGNMRYKIAYSKQTGEYQLLDRTAADYDTTLSNCQNNGWIVAGQEDGTLACILHQSIKDVSVFIKACADMCASSPSKQSGASPLWIKRMAIGALVVAGVAFTAAVGAYVMKSQQQHLEDRDEQAA